MHTDRQPDKKNGDLSSLSKERRLIIEKQVQIFCMALFCMLETTNIAVI
jgi:hypothetical protein